MYVYNQKSLASCSHGMKHPDIWQSSQHQICPVCLAIWQQSTDTGNRNICALGGVGPAEQDVVLTTVADADKLTGLSAQVSANLRLMKWGIHHAARYIRDMYKIDRSQFIPTIRLLATSGGYQDYPRQHVDRLLRRASAVLSNKNMAIDEIEKQAAQHVAPLPLRRGTGIWITLDTRSQSKAIVGLGPPHRAGPISGLHEGMHALSNPQGLARNTVLSEGGAEYFARQAARAQDLSYEKRYGDQEAIFGKLVTDFVDQMMAETFFGNGLSAFEIAFDKKYGSGSYQRFVSLLEVKDLIHAAQAIGLDYETMDGGRP